MTLHGGVLKWSSRIFAVMCPVGSKSKGSLHSAHTSCRAFDSSYLGRSRRPPRLSVLQSVQCGFRKKSRCRCVMLNLFAGFTLTHVSQKCFVQSSNSPLQSSIHSRQTGTFWFFLNSESLNFDLSLFFTYCACFFHNQCFFDCVPIQFFSSQLP